MIAKAFAPFPGVKAFAIMAADTGVGREHARVDAAGDESWEHAHDAAVPAGRSTAGTRVVFEILPGTSRVHDNDRRSCNGLRRVIRLPSTGVGRTSSVALLIVRCRALGVFRDRPLVSLCRQLSSAIRRGGDEQHGVGDGLARSGNRSVGGVRLLCGAGGEETRALEEITAAQPGGLPSPGPQRCRGTVRRGGGAGACGPR